MSMLKILLFCHSARNVLRKKTKEKEFIYLYNYLFIKPDKCRQREPKHKLNGHLRSFKWFWTENNVRILGYSVSLF